MFWESVVAATFIISFFLTPLNMATIFVPYESDFKTIEIIIDVIIILDICVNMVSETVKDVEVIVYLKDAALMYIKSYFFVDLISILPNVIHLE